MRNHRVVLMALLGLALTEAKLSRDERSALRVERRLAPIGGTQRVENSTATQVRWVGLRFEVAANPSG